MFAYLICSTIELIIFVSAISNAKPIIAQITAPITPTTALQVTVSHFYTLLHIGAFLSIWKNGAGFIPTPIK